MRSLQFLSLVLVAGAAAIVLPPAITSPPVVEEKRDGPDAASLALVLLTAVPESIREVAATNIAGASSILWSEFLDGNRPSWFTELPEEIQQYLIQTFGPKTAAPPVLPTIPIIFPSLTESAIPSSTDDGQWRPSRSIQSSEASITGTPSTSRIAETSRTGSAVIGSDRASVTRSASSSQTTKTAIISLSHSASGPSSSLGRSSLATSGLTFSTELTAPSASTTEALPAPSSGEQSDLSQNQKIGIGVGVPLGILGAAALLLACCFLLRRRQRKKVAGSVPPSSPGFIPRFSFQEKTRHDDLEQRPLNRGAENSLPDWNNSMWDDDVVEPVQDQQPAHNTIQHQQWPVSHQQPAFAPIIAPLLHTHSSNKARGKRTSYTSLHSVAEVSEPEEMESPVLGRDLTPRNSPARSSPARQSLQRPSITIPPIPEAAQIKRKPIGSPPSQSPAAEVASQTLLRQTMGHSSDNQNRYGNHASVSATSPVSPIDGYHSRNPFRNSYSYVEDYGPEYHGGYVDAVENGMFGGHTSLSRYPEPESRSSKPEWPLRNATRHKRTKSPMWDRVYEG